MDIFIIIIVIHFILMTQCMHKIQDKVHNMKADVQNIYDKTKKYKEENQKKAAKKI